MAVESQKFDMPVPSPCRARAIQLGERLAIDHARHSGIVSTAPFCLRTGSGYAVAFRYGVLVFIGLSPAEEEAVSAEFADEVVHPVALEEERVAIEPGGEDEGPAPGGILRIRALSLAHVLVIADILAKSVALARYERETAQVFDTIEPAARTLAVSGRIPIARKALLQMIGAALLAQHRVAGRIAFAEKPDVLWEQPELGRLFGRLEDEYEIVERGTLLNGKMGVLGSAAETFTDMIDTARSARLELLIVLLILAEIVLAVIPLLRR